MKEGGGRAVTEESDDLQAWLGKPARGRWDLPRRYSRWRRGRHPRWWPDRYDTATAQFTYIQADEIHRGAMFEELVRHIAARDRIAVWGRLALYGLFGLGIGLLAARLPHQIGVWVVAGFALACCVRGLTFLHAERHHMDRIVVAAETLRAEIDRARATPPENP